MIGEATYTKTGFRPLLEKRAADILNPDVACVGGILELKEIAAMAESFLVAMSPHNYNSTLVALASTVHASAVMPNFIITEYFLPFVEFCDQISPNQLKPKNGYIDLPTAPGLGIDVDEEALKKYPGKVYPLRKLRTPAKVGIKDVAPVGGMKERGRMGGGREKEKAGAGWTKITFEGGAGAPLFGGGARGALRRERGHLLVGGNLLKHARVRRGKAGGYLCS